jgi:outer membrane immunogenic protein
MKRLFVASVIFVGLSSLAQAADLPRRTAPVYKAPPVVAAPFSWSGFYIGGQVGYQWGGDHNITATDAPGPTTLGPFPFKSNGIVGGGHAGVNWQTGQWVLGIEGDFEGSGVDGNLNVSVFGTDTSVLSFKQKWQASLRGRLGWAFDRNLLYVTGGGAWSKFTHDATFDTTGVLGGPLVEPSWSDTVSGWTIGVGLEHAFTQNLSARVEYRYTDFDSFSHASVAVPPATVHTNDLTYSTVRVGLSYRFGGNPLPY